MRYKKMIQEILGTELEEQGFAYMPNSSWSYERVKDQVWQSVSVVRERYCKESDSWEAVVKAVQDKIEETWDEPFSEVEEMLIGLAALYAYALNEGEEGEWKWHDKANVCILDNLRGTFVQIFPLLDIITAWKGKNLSILSNRQENILIYYNKYVRKAP